MSILSAEKVKSGPVADSELLRLFLVGWDVPASYTQFPVPFGVRR
jgi:hypothetical protein